MMKTAGSVLLVLSLVLVSAASAAETTRLRHSGTVVAIDPERGVLILAELGPWHVKKGETVVTRRTITVTPDTKVDKFIRVNVPGAFAGDFIAVALDAADVSPGDFVTVDCLHERGRLIALRVTVAEVD